MCHNQNMSRKTSDLMEAPNVRSLGGDFIQEPLHTNPFEDVQALKQPSMDEDGNIHKKEKTVLGDEGESQGCITSSNRESVEAGSCTEDSPKKRTEALTREVHQNCVIYSDNVSDVESFAARIFSQVPFTGAGYSDGVLMDQNLTTLNGQYRVNKEFLQDKMIGKGDFGIVIACHDWKTREKIATKMILKKNLHPFELSLLAEVRSMPFIIGFLGATTEGSILYLHMELFEGARHLEYFAQEGWKHLRSQLIVVQICHQLLQALDYLSRRQIIHRDLTGRNILLKPAPVVRVIDFGLAVRAPYKQKTDDVPTGDPLYFAPEIFDGDTFLTTACDVWSAAINIIFLLRGSAECKACDPPPGEEWHPLMCSHINHCHLAIRELFAQMLYPKCNKRPLPFELLEEEIFKVSSEELQQYPVHPAPSNIGRRKPPGSGKLADGGISVGMGLPSGDSGLVSSLKE